MGRIVTNRVFAVAYSVDSVPQAPVLVEAGDASDADATVVMHAQSRPGAAGRPVRIQALDEVSAARWAGVPETPILVESPPEEEGG
jgi:uncharacterized NAD-dependent epimerase/dehydratase family protein